MCHKPLEARITMRIETRKTCVVPFKRNFVKLGEKDKTDKEFQCKAKEKLSRQNISLSKNIQVKIKSSLLIL